MVPIQNLQISVQKMMRMSADKEEQMILSISTAWTGLQYLAGQDRAAKRRGCEERVYVASAAPAQLRRHHESRLILVHRRNPSLIAGGPRINQSIDLKRERSKIQTNFRRCHELPTGKDLEVVHRCIARNPGIP